MKIYFEILVYLLAAYGVYSLFLLIKGKNYEDKIATYLKSIEGDASAKIKGIEQHLKEFVKKL
jgi:hypothetical protein